MGQGTPLGEFLRARRAGVSPLEAGIPEYTRRRVKGLRREEVSMLAGVSGDYYVRLEQGRESRPSRQVLDAVAHALRLDEEATAHLHRLAAAPTARRRFPSDNTEVGDRLLRLLDGWREQPAFVLGPDLDILACNPMATVLHQGFTVDDNLARMVFADPAGRDFYRDWDRSARAAVAELRAAYGHDPARARLAELVAELSALSPRFAELWASHEVRGKTGDRKRLLHPEVGELEIDFLSFTVNGAPGQQLVVYQAEPATPTAAAFERLLARAAALV
ncbi:helix-turn-helix transcriptional regulator [Streptomyces sp. AK02-01A]|uniref:helix-turn-helix transcriptional regulator n=1 Tax=Streptomyces sp. AK02-01A TaxID=3028648 RepID=UPI0029BB599D|nr:helix-turn-helix transcriptional regulator [Streptomyces sp. AK02-01A]MDX3852787.1 helix-turn-helix transcriptional regulator [Streptomyces sp. AK02-01A]